ncbi:MAG: S1 RNA-binding domain-containing protein [Candidatus Promineifilaceae bacterium]
MTNDNFEAFLDQHDYEKPEVGDIRTGIIVSISPSSVIVDLGVKQDGVVPASDLAKLSQEEREALKVNDEIPVYVVSTDKPDSLIVSIHLAQLNQDWINAEALMKSGEMIEAEVIGYNKGGAIVPYGRLRGFIPASHLSDLPSGLNDRNRQQRLAKLRGETIPVKIIEVDRRRRRLVMSQREAQKEWEEKRKAELLESLKEGDVVKGRVSGLRDFGIFVDLGGADGLVHISELAWHRISHPREVVRIGDEIEVVVLKLDKEEQRISLSRKKLLPNPWDSVAERYKQNQLVEGKITRLVDYGAFAEIEPGVEGLLHITQLSRNNVDKVSDVVNVGETHLLRIVSIDQERQRIGLSLKAVTVSEQLEWMAKRDSEKASKIEDATAVAEADALAETGAVEEE